MRRLFLPILLIMPGSAAFTQQSSDDIPADKRKQAVAEIRKRMAYNVERNEKITAMKSALEHAKAGVIDAKVKEPTFPAVPSKTTPVRFPTKAAKEQHLMEATAELKKWASVAKPNESAPTEFVGRLTDFRVGSFGTLPHSKLRVARVVDATSVILATRTGLPGLQPNEDIELFVSSLDTSKMADNLAIAAPAGTFYVIGNKRVGGTTYFHLVPFKLTEAETESLTKSQPKK